MLLKGESRGKMGWGETRHIEEMDRTSTAVEGQLSRDGGGEIGRQRRGQQKRLEGDRSGRRGGVPGSRDHSRCNLKVDGTHLRVGC